MAQLYEYGLFLDDLFRPRKDGEAPAERLPVLLGTTTGVIYEPLLRDSWVRWTKTPKALATGGAALAGELKGADASWDWLSFALKRIGDVMATAPADLVSAEAREAGRILTEILVPSLSVRNDAYARTGARSNELRSQLETHATALGALSVPGPTAGAVVPVLNWAERRAAAAQTVADLLSQRASLTAAAPSEEQVQAAFTLRSTTEGYVNRARAALADELRGDPQKAAEIDHAIFGLLDQTVASGAAKAKPVAEEAPEPDEVTPGS